MALGLSNVIPADPQEVWHKMKPVSFNPLGRVFWEHQLFDVIAYNAGFASSPRPSLPNVKQLAELRQATGVNVVSHLCLLQ